MEQMYVMEQIIYCLLLGKVLNLTISIYTPYVPCRNSSNFEKMTDERKITEKRTQDTKKGTNILPLFHTLNFVSSYRSTLVSKFMSL